MWTRGRRRGAQSDNCVDVISVWSLGGAGRDAAGLDGGHDGALVLQAAQAAGPGSGSVLGRVHRVECERDAEADVLGCYSVLP